MKFYTITAKRGSGAIYARAYNRRADAAGVAQELQKASKEWRIKIQRVDACDALTACETARRWYCNSVAFRVK